MKKSLIIIFIVIAIVILGVFVYGKATEQVTFSNKEGITTVLTLEDEIQNNTIWCGTFQLIFQTNITTKNMDIRLLH